MAAPPPARHRFRLAAAVALFALSAGLFGLAAQPPEEEEEAPKSAKKQVPEEEGKGAPKKKIVVVDPDGPSTPKAGGSPPDVKLDEVAKAAETAPLGLKDVYARFAVPFDQVTLAKGGTLRIKPLRPHRSDPGYKTSNFDVTEVSATGQAGETRPLKGSEVKQIEHFEDLAVAEADKLLKDQATAGGATPDLRATAAERLLAGALRYHDYARDKGQRAGKGWDAARPPLVEKLKDARLVRLQRAVAGQDWPRALEIGNILLRENPKDPAVAREVTAARVAVAGPLMRTGNHADRVRVRQMLDGLDPNAGGDEARKIRRDLTAAADQLYQRAVGHKNLGNLVDARNDAAKAAELDRDVPGLRQLQEQLGTASPVLYVGARRFPERMSPATARFDSERQVVELLFQPLLEEVPDKNGGVRYVPAAALGPPLVVPAGRVVSLRQAQKTADGGGVDPADVVATVRLLRGRPDTWAAAPLPWLDDLPDPKGGATVRLGFAHGHPDPRALLTFKLLPGRRLEGKAVDDLDFANRPEGTTGAYKVHGWPDAGAAGPRELVLTESPGYGKAPGRAGLPHLREIRVVDIARMTDPLEEFKANRLHILPDVTQAEIDRVRKGERTEFNSKAVLVTARTNRRVHILAVNQRQPAFRNLLLRQGLNLVLDRDAVVRDVYRYAPTNLQVYGVGLTGPFPPHAWATVKDSANRPVPILNRAAGADKLKEYLKSPGAAPKHTLLYPADDPLAAAACNKLAQQVAALGLATPDGQPLALVPTPTPPRDMIRLVEDEHRYDLAYVPFEYPDDWYPFGLAAFLDPRAGGRGGRNWTGFGTTETNPGKEERELMAQLDALMEHRDFEKELLPRAKRVHDAFNVCVPFIPLWHADRHMLVHAGLKVHLDDGPDPALPDLLNQTTLFQNVIRWRLEP